MDVSWSVCSRSRDQCSIGLAGVAGTQEGNGWQKRRERKTMQKVGRATVVVWELDHTPRRVHCHVERGGDTRMKEQSLGQFVSW